MQSRVNSKSLLSDAFDSLLAYYPDKDLMTSVLSLKAMNDEGKFFPWEDAELGTSEDMGLSTAQEAAEYAGGVDYLIRLLRAPRLLDSYKQFVCFPEEMGETALVTEGAAIGGDDLGRQWYYLALEDISRVSEFNGSVYLLSTLADLPNRLAKVAI